MRYAIRAEFAENKHEDFGVNAITLLDAYTNAEVAICRRHTLSSSNTQFDWRGQVVFVNQGMGVRV